MRVACSVRAGDAGAASKPDRAGWKGRYSRVPSHWGTHAQRHLVLQWSVYFIALTCRAAYI